MLEFMLDSSSFDSLNQGNGLMAEGETSFGPIEFIKSGLYKDVTSYVFVTHIMTRWNGRVDDKKRKLARTPFKLDSASFPCKSMKFSSNGANYELNSCETFAGGYEDFIHQSDVICTALEGRFSATDLSGFQKRVEEYASFANVLYTRFYKRNAPRVLLKFQLPNRRIDFANVINNHSQTPSPKKVAAGVSESKEDSKHFGNDSIKIGIDDIGGLFKPKERVISFLRRVNHPEAYEKVGIDLSRLGGMFFFGGSGNGKTLMAEAIQTELEKQYGSNFVSYFLDYSNFADIYRGGEAGKIAKLFQSVGEHIKSNKKVLLYIDEAQQIGQRHEHFRHGCDNEALNTILAKTSRLDYRQCVLIFSTAQDPGTIDAQLRRKGRAGYHVFFNNPSSKEAIDIMKKALAERARRGSIEKFVSEEGIDFNCLANIACPNQGENSPGLLPLSDYYFLVDEVLEKRVQEIIKSGSFRPLETGDYEELVKERVREKAKIPIL